MLFDNDYAQGLGEGVLGVRWSRARENWGPGKLCSFETIIIHKAS